MAQVNWAQLAKDAGDMTPLPKGRYDVVVDSAELKVAGTGNEYYKLKFKVQSGPHVGRVLYNNVVLSTASAGALQAFFRNMLALGITQDQIASTGGDTAAVVPLLSGRQAVVTVGHQEYQGQVRENVERMERRGGVQAGPVSPSTSPSPGVSPSTSPSPSAPSTTPPAPSTPGAAAPTPPIPQPVPAGAGVAAPPMPF